MKLLFMIFPVLFVVVLLVGEIIFPHLRAFLGHLRR
jgi:hypothetical protein